MSLFKAVRSLHLLVVLNSTGVTAGDWNSSSSTIELCEVVECVIVSRCLRANSVLLGTEGGGCCHLNCRLSEKCLVRKFSSKHTKFVAGSLRFGGI